MYTWLLPVYMAKQSEPQLYWRKKRQDGKWQFYKVDWRLEGKCNCGVICAIAKKPIEECLSCFSRRHLLDKPDEANVVDHPQPNARKESEGALQ